MEYIGDCHDQCAHWSRNDTNVRNSTINRNLSLCYFLWAVKRSLGLYHFNRDGFRRLQYTDMSQDFSWNVPAGRYMELFYRMLG